MDRKEEKILEWKITANTSSHKKLVEKTRRLIEDALEKAKFALSWSAGKDSTAMVHLVRSIDHSIPIMIQYDDCDWPEKRDYAMRVCANQGWKTHDVTPNFSVWGKAIELRIGWEDICSQDHDLTKCGFLKPMDEMRKSLGCNGVFLGLRIQESRVRKINLLTRGPLYLKNDGVFHCCPMWNWKTQDIFAYLASCDIEINPCYFQNRFRNPEEIRLAWALPTSIGLSTGDMAHMRHYYPEQFRRLREADVT